MDLVRNLKKILKNMAEKILVELSCHYIKQRAKQTLRRHDNSSQIMSLRKHLTTEYQHTTIATSSPGTSEKIIMATKIEPVVQVRDWAIERIQSAENYEIAVAISEEFLEWLDPDDTEELEYFSLEMVEDYGDQEIDVK